MTKDEIKKGLECCCNDSDFKNACRNCSYLTCPGCNDTLCKDALNLITEQEKEIEQLKDDYAKLQELFAQYQMASDKEIRAQVKQAEKRIDNLKRDYSNAFERLKAQQREIDGLKAENEELTKVVSSKVYDFIDNAKEIADAREVWEQQAKIEAVKDFAEELKAKTMCIKEYEDGIRILQTSNKLIDQSVKIFLDELIKEVKE